MLATFGGLWFLVTSVWAWWFIFSPVFDLFSRWCDLRIAMKTFFLICPCSFLYWHHNMENRWNAQSEWTDYNAAAWLFMDSGSDFYKKWILKRKWPSFFLNCLFIEQCKDADSQVMRFAKRLNWTAFVLSYITISQLSWYPTRCHSRACQPFF